MCTLPQPLRRTSDSSSLQFHTQRDDAPGVRLSARNIRKIIMTSLRTLVFFFLLRVLTVSVVSVGVIRGVGLASQPTRQREGPRGTRERTESNDLNHHHHHNHHAYLLLWGDVASCQTAEGRLFAYSV